MTRLPDSERTRSLLGKRGAFEGVARWPWMASGMGTDEAQSTSTNRSRHSPQCVVQKVGRSITNSETHRTLQVLVDQIRGLETEIADSLDVHPDGEIFRSFFKTDSVICAATLLAEIGDCRSRYPHRDAIAADAGQAPVAVESGKRNHAKFRWACNKRLRNALATLAHCTCRWNPWAADRYANARQRGHNHRRALRTLGRAWARIIWRCWQTHTPYDPARYTGLQQHILVTIPTTSGPRPDLPLHPSNGPSDRHPLMS
jgi:Transposase IS116/IS110/IS902 family